MFKFDKCSRCISRYGCPNKEISLTCKAYQLDPDIIDETDMSIALNNPGTAIGMGRLTTKTTTE